MQGAFSTEDILAQMQEDELAHLRAGGYPQDRYKMGPGPDWPEALDRLGGFAYDMHPAAGVVHGAQALGEGDYGKALLEASGLLPFVGGAPKALAKGVAGAMTARPATSTAGLAGGAFLADTSIAEDEPGQSFSEKIGRLRTRKETLFNEMTSLQKELSGVAEATRERIMALPVTERQKLVGAKPDGEVGSETRGKIEAFIQKEVEKASKTAQDRLNALKGEQTSLQAQIDYEMTNNSPEAIQERQRTTPIRELDPNFASNALGLGAAGGLTLAALLRGKGLYDFNKLVGGLGDDAARTASEAADAYKAGRFADASQGYSAAKSMQGQLDKAYAAGPKSQTLAPMMAAIGGTELGAHAPGIWDYARSSGQSGDPLYDAAHKSMWGGEYFPGQNFVERTLQTAIPAGIAGKVVGAAGKPFQRAKPRGATTNLETFDDITSGAAAKRAGEMATQYGKLAGAEARGLNHHAKRQRALADAERGQKDAAQLDQLADLRRTAELKQAQGQRLTKAETRALEGPPEPAQAVPPPKGQPQGQSPQGGSGQTGQASGSPSNQGGGQPKGNNPVNKVQGLEVTKSDVDQATQNLAKTLGQKVTPALRERVKKSLPDKWIDEAHKKSVLGSLTAALGGTIIADNLRRGQQPSSVPKASAQPVTASGVLQNRIQSLLRGSKY